MLTKRVHGANPLKTQNIIMTTPSRGCRRYRWRSMRMAVGNDAGHDPPITPLAPLSAIAVDVTLPLTVALPVQTVPSAATPLNDNWPSSDDPLKVGVRLPEHETH